MLSFGENMTSAITITDCGYCDEFERLANLVRQVTGWRDGPAFRGKLEMILGGSDEDTAATWLRRLGRGHGGSGEWQTVIERLMVPETFFFRDAPQLDVLRYRVLPEIIANKRHGTNRTIRIWSAGCSSGEEPYTLAMLILDALLTAGEAVELGSGIVTNPGWSIHIQGTDLNPTIIEKARTGVYSDFGLSPFRETPPLFRRFFVLHDDSGSIARYRLRQDIRSITHFGVHNIKEEPVGADFDLVSCRNVLIYFDEGCKRRAIDNLGRALVPAGYLMLGSTDPFDELPDFNLIEPRTSPILRKPG